MSIRSQQLVHRGINQLEEAVLTVLHDLDTHEKPRSIFVISHHLSNPGNMLLPGEFVQYLLRRLEERGRARFGDGLWSLSNSEYEHRKDVITY